MTRRYASELDEGVTRWSLQPVRSEIRNGLGGRGDQQCKSANEARDWRFRGRQRRGTTAVAARAARIGKMLELIVVTIMMMTGEPAVMVALVVVRN